MANTAFVLSFYMNVPALLSTLHCYQLSSLSRGRNKVFAAFIFNSRSLVLRSKILKSRSRETKGLIIRLVTPVRSQRCGMALSKVIRGPYFMMELVAQTCL